MKLSHWNHKTELNIVPIFRFLCMLRLIVKYLDKFALQCKSTLYAKCLHVFSCMHPFTVSYKTCLMCLQGHRIMTLSSSCYMSTLRLENIFSGKQTAYKIQCTLSESSYCSHALYSPPLLMTTHRRIYLIASFSMNLRRPSFCGHTSWSNVAGFASLFCPNCCMEWWCD